MNTTHKNMNFKIQFFDKNTGETFVNNHSLFVMGNEVWGNNGCYYESQEASIGFEDCIKPFPHLGWRVIQND